MPKTIFTPEELSRYFSGKYFHPGYNETVEMVDKIRVHSDGQYPECLIEERRPSESLAVKDYRKKIWEPITEWPISKVFSSLNKIRRSSDWSIQFDESKFPKSIRMGERLDDYLVTDYPYHASLTNWLFDVLLKNYLIDANAVICVMPLLEETPENDYVRPYAYIFNSEQVIDYVQDDYAVLKSRDKCVFKEIVSGKTKEHFGDIYFIVTAEKIERWEQINTKKEYALKYEFVHALGQLPAFKAKGIIKKTLDGTFIYKSRIATMVPHLNEAVREYSDLQAGVVSHLYPEKWEYVSDDCPDCKGKGRITGAGFMSSGTVTCSSCEGTGSKARGPYSTLQLKPPMAGEATFPTPPVGYVNKDVEIIKVQDDRIDRHVYKALAAVNMEFLSERPLDQSGVAKAYDADETNNFVHSIAENVVAVADSVAYFTNEYRYRVVVPNEEQRDEMLPNIAVPEKFDLISSTMLEKELSDARGNKVNPVIMVALEIDYANKKFNADPEVRDKVALMLSLDPLAGISEDDKMMRLNNGGITKETYIISCNINDFIQRAIDDKGDAFFGLSLKDKKILMKQYALEQLQEGSAAKEILSEEITG